MIVGTEWLVEATDCDPEKLRQMHVLQIVFARIIEDLKLKIIGQELWHQFAAPGAGVTGLVMLTESHLACHTYPEHRAATFNLYCCRIRPEWEWTLNLQNLLGAGNVNVQKIERGQSNPAIRRMTFPAQPRAHRSSRQDDGVTTGGAGEGK